MEIQRDSDVFSSSNSRLQETDHYSRTCILCEALLPTAAKLEHHLITAHHVVDSCLKNVLQLSHSKQIELNGSTPLHKHRVQQYSDDESDKFQSCTYSSSRNYRDYDQQSQQNQRRCAPFTGSDHSVNGTFDSSIKTKRPNDQSNTTLQKRSISNAFENGYKNESDKMPTDFNCFQQLIDISDNGCTGLPVEIEKNVQAIARWIKHVCPLFNVNDRRENSHFDNMDENMDRSCQLDHQQWSPRSLPDSISELSTTDSSAISDSLPTEPLKRLTCHDHSDKEISDVLQEMIDKIASVNGERFFDYVGYSSPPRYDYDNNISNWTNSNSCFQENNPFLLERTDSEEFVDHCKQSAVSFPETNGSQSQHFQTKQMRTHILPEQQKNLMKYYLMDSNPSRYLLEEIALKVGLKKRVVQVWFQNTRARERRATGSKFQDLSCSPAAAWFAVAAAAAAASMRNSSDFQNNCCRIGERSSQHKVITDNFEPNFEPNVIIPSKSLKIDENAVRAQKSPVKDMCWKSSIENVDTVVKNEPNENDALDYTTSMPSIENEQQFTRSTNSLSCQTKKSRSESYYMGNRFNILHQPTHQLSGYLSNPVSSSNGNSNSVVRRFRTQMSPLQVRIMKAIFVDYKTPTMPECEALGREIGLQKRVVQVWFQNARAKEKKNPDHIRCELSGSSSSECSLCGIKYDGFTFIQRDHLFSAMHINSLRECFLNNCKQDSMKDKRDLMSPNASPDSHVNHDTINVDNIDSMITTKDDSVYGSKGALIAHHSINSDDQNVLSVSHYKSKSTDDNSISQQHTTTYDPDIYGTPLRLLRIPLLGLSHISKMIQDDASIAQYTDDSSSSSEITRMGFPVTPISIDVGFVCKLCQLAWPRYQPCLKHINAQHSSVFNQAIPIKGSFNDNANYNNYILKIEQLLHRCDDCGESFGTLAEVVQHTRGENACHSSVVENQSIRSTSSKAPSNWHAEGRTINHNRGSNR